MQKNLIIGEELGSETALFSTKLADEAIARGYQVFECLNDDIIFDSGKVYALAKEYPEGEKQKVEIKTEFDIVHFRSNPPVDIRYMSTLYVLRLIEDEVLIVNKPSALINFPEKIFPHILGDYSPASLISNNIDEIKSFAKTHGEIVAKPLYGFGGFDIKKLTADEVDSKLADGINIYQEFLPEVSQGTVRINLINGEICGYLRKLPPPDSIESNRFKGGAEKTELSNKQKEICTQLKPICQKEGLFLCSLDFIGDKLLEVNVTSVGTRGVFEISGIEVEKEYWDKIECLKS